MKRHFQPPKVVSTAIAALACLATSALAQQTVETGDGLLQLSASMPEEARVGEQFTYTIDVTNTSDTVTLHDIRLKHRKAKGFTVESVQVQSKDSSSSNESNKSSQDSETSDEEKNSNAGSSSDESSESSDGSKQSHEQIKISTLKPGESRSVEVKASADEEGELRSCLQIVNYMPAICLTSDVVKPELQITKVAPKKANRCNMIELEYTVTNDGSGDLGTFQVVDSLSDGLMTIEGNNELKFDVDGLDAGETRQFVGRVYATKPGEFSSRAVAKAKSSDMKARSKNTTTKVIAADLNVTVEGPGRLYGDELATFTAKVENTGDATAEDVRVKVFWPQETNLADLGEPAMEMSKDKQNSSDDSENENSSDSDEDSTPTVAANEKNSSNSSNNSSDDSSNSSDQKDNGRNESDVKMAQETFTIDSLEPGQIATFEYAVRPGEVEDIPTRVEARHVCTIDHAEGQAKSKSEAVDKGYAQAKIVRLPAMQLVVYDDEDPVTTGSQVVYSIRVWNEGDATDQNIELKAKLPDGLEFASADGPTEHEFQGSTVTFKPIKKMESGDRADFTVTANSDGEGNVRFEAELTSESLNKAVLSEEPTTLFAENTSQN